MEEHASVLFKFTENRASRAPRNIVIRPSVKIRRPYAVLPKRACVAVMIIPYTPTLVRMPDRRADPGDGATGWAFGSHTWTGNIPALHPNPIRMQTAAAKILRPEEGSFDDVSTAAASSRKLSVPQVSRMSRRPIKRTRPPITAIKR